MGHCPHKLSVLEYGAAAHPLDDPPGGGEQAGIGDLDHKVPAVSGAFGENFHDLNVELLHLGPSDVGQDGGRACPDLRPVRRRNGLPVSGQTPVGEGPKDAAAGVGPKLAQVVADLEGALELSRLP